MISVRFGLPFPSDTLPKLVPCLGVVSIHGTSTQANEKNETAVYNDVFTTIGRTPGNAVPVMAQKSLTGHPKGGAAAWMLAGLCQSVITGIVPGNRNAEYVYSNWISGRSSSLPSLGL